MSSTEVSTQPSTGWVALSAADRHLIVRGPASAANELQGPLESGVVEVLQALGRDGLRALPDFALVDTSGDQTRVILRGDVEVRADGSALSSDGRMPWSDRDVDAAAIELGEENKGGWRRPTRLGRPTAVVAAAVPEPAAKVEEPSPEADGELDVVAEPVEDVAPEPEPEPEPAHESEPEAQAEAEAEEAPEPEAAAEPEPVVEPEAEPEPEPAPVAEAPAVAVAPPVPAADLTLPPSEEYAGAAPAERIPPAKAPSSEKKVLIDSVPWRTLPDGARPDAPAAAADGPAAEVEAEQPAPTPAPEPVPVPEPVPAPGADSEEPAIDGPTGPDNWGMTGPPLTQAPDPLGAEPGPESAPGADVPEVVAPPVPDVTMDRAALTPGTEGPADSPVVLAVLCPAGHHSSPHASNCRVCGRDIPTQQPFQTPRPQLGTLAVSTGGLVPLDRGILLGRAPKVNADLPPSSRPHLVRLASQDNDISRNHAEIILEGWHVLVRDLGSTNGTTVTLPGQEPVRLRPTEDFGIEPGAVLTLADEVSLTYEVSE